VRGRLVVERRGVAAVGAGGGREQVVWAAAGGDAGEVVE
jgi:hypothetical protein